MSQVHLEGLMKGIQKPYSRVSKALESILINRFGDNLDTSRRGRSKTFLDKDIFMRLGVLCMVTRIGS